jgi:hypothetical protein
MDDPFEIFESITGTDLMSWTSPIKRSRRISAEIAALLSATLRIVDGEETAITIRHLFYRLVGINVIEKTEQAYKLLCHHLGRWRKAGLVPWDAFTDSTRWYLHEPMFDGIADAFKRTLKNYRRDLWATQPYYVEVWIEKDAIAGVIDDVTNEFGVPLFVCRGFASLSSIYSASRTFKEAQDNGKQVILYHLGDYDPSGHAAADAIEKTLRKDFNCLIQFERIAILKKQIEEFNLPTRPTKETDSRSRNWTGSECVELDSMPPRELRALVRDLITSLIDSHAWEQTKKIEREERKTMERAVVKFAA